MFKASAMLYLYVETPLHPGSGSGLALVDLPVQRERITGYPMMQASGLKGKMRAEGYGAYDLPLVLQHKAQVKANLISDGAPDNDETDRKAHRQAVKELVEIVFGPETAGASGHAGAISPGDARILLFPVRSLLGVFAWTTSRTALERFHRDLQAAESVNPRLDASLAVLAAALSGLPDDLKESEAFIAPQADVAADKQLTLEEFTFDTREVPAVKSLGQWLADNAFPFDNATDEYAYWRSKVLKSLVILPDNAFRDFAQYATEIINRIRLNREKKTVESGALWSEEHLPSDTLLYAPLFASHPRRNGVANVKSASEVMQFVQQLCQAVPRLQLGGDETVGRGLVKLRYNGG